MAVVERLRVVGIRPALEQQPGERRPIAVRGRAAAERPGQRGERRAEALPQVARVRIGAVVEQEPGDVRRRAPGSGEVESRVGEVEQRLPTVRAALDVGLGRVALEQLSRGGDVARRSGRVDARAREPRVGFEHLPRSAPASGIVAAVGQARQPQELVDQRLLVANRSADGLAVRRARVSLHPLEVRLELRPAGEPEPARDHQLCVRASERSQLRRPGRRLPEPGMELADDLGGAGVAG